MKKIVLWIFLATLTLASCRKPQDPPPVTSVLLKNDWRVSFCRDNGTNRTSLYSGWKFTFLAADSSVTITTGGGTYLGKWSENTNARSFTLTINAPLFETALISRTWQVVLINPGRIRLADDRFNPRQELWFDIFE
ncbi:MAG TPA: hypothetical protein PKE63_04920 [Lacibacter sp.]|nr:hypothetical protein [Lacibacter sp.]HMO90497.1 hypothetical protein [Lacibacter sp.]HMP86596.1 hypothetical protein [Lacibacter sp.]